MTSDVGLKENELKDKNEPEQTAIIIKKEPHLNESNIKCGIQLDFEVASQNVKVENDTVKLVPNNLFYPAKMIFLQSENVNESSIATTDKKVFYAVDMTPQPLMNMTDSRKRRRSEMLENFLEDVKKFNFLYDKHHRYFKDTARKSSAWNVIGLKFGMTAAEAEKKWKVQRDRYCKEKKKVRESIGTNGNLEAYVPSWTMYPKMDSILSGKTNQKDRSESAWTSIPKENNNLEFNCENFSEVIPEDYVQTKLEKGESEENSEIICSLDSENTLSSSSSCASICNKTSIAVQPKKSSLEIGAFNGAFKGFQTPTANLNECAQLSKTEGSKSDITEQFCSYLCNRLKSLDKRDRFEAKCEIEAIMQQKERQEKYME